MFSFFSTTYLHESAPGTFIIPLLYSSNLVASEFFLLCISLPEHGDFFPSAQNCQWILTASNRKSHTILNAVVWASQRCLDMPCLLTYQLSTYRYTRRKSYPFLHIHDIWQFELTFTHTELVYFFNFFACLIYGWWDLLAGFLLLYHSWDCWSW